MDIKQLNVLLADDDIDDCNFFETAINELSLNTKLVIVNDGERLMEHLMNETTELPHMLFLDLNMPRKNGFECLLEIKLNKKLENIPIIVYSTSLEQEGLNELYKNGAQYFIRKPNEFVHFKNLIQKSLAMIGRTDDKKILKENFVLTLNKE
jgi:response regulator RpfG family c-di-GMP phosphodiesterase